MCLKFLLTPKWQTKNNEKSGFMLQKLNSESLPRLLLSPVSEICCCPCLVEVTTTAAMSFTCREACCSVYSFLLLRLAFTCKSTCNPSAWKHWSADIEMVRSLNHQRVHTVKPKMHFWFDLEWLNSLWETTGSLSVPLRQQPAAQCSRRSRASRR